MAPKRKGRVKTRQRTVEIGCAEEVDTEEDIRARSIIERLSRKYLHKSPNASASTRGNIEVPSPVMETSRSSEDAQEKSFDERHFELSHSLKHKPKPKRLTKRTVKSKLGHPSRKVLSTSTECNASLNPEQNLSCAKAPRPTLGHSTPSNASKTLATSENSMFGFEEFETPLGFFPVISEDGEDSLSRSVSKSPQKSGLSFANMDRVYSVPSHKTRRRQAAKKSGFCESEVKQWMTELNNQFDEVDNFELVVE